MSDYGRTSGTGETGSAAVTNDDEYTQTDLPESTNPSEWALNKYMDKRAY